MTNITVIKLSKKKLQRKTIKYMQIKFCPVAICTQQIMLNYRGVFRGALGHGTPSLGRQDGIISIE